MSDDYCLSGFYMTGPALARVAGVAPATVRLYADLGLIEFQRASNGVRHYRASAAPKVRSILEARLANRGGNRRRGFDSPAD